jgi:ribosomal protein S18 acetylase RimI-like enzyme
LSTISFSFIEFGTPSFDVALALRYQVLRKPLGLFFEEAEIAQEYLQLHFGCYDQSTQELLGTLTLKPCENAAIKMRQVAVDPNCQSKGIGTFMVLQSEAYAKAKGYKKMELHARLSAVPFYQKLGYFVEGEGFTEVGIDHLYMYKAM